MQVDLNIRLADIVQIVIVIGAMISLWWTTRSRVKSIVEAAGEVKGLKDVIDLTMTNPST